MRKIKGIHILLIVLVFLIWILAIKRFVTYSVRSDKDASFRENSEFSGLDLTGTLPPEREKFVYKKTYRNPFLPATSNSEIKSEKKERIKRVPEISYTLDGIIYKKDKSIAVIRDRLDRTHFLSTGDSLGSFIISKIYPDSVVCSVSGDYNITLSVNR